MKAVVQRVKGATLVCEGKIISRIGYGLVVFFGVAKGDEKPTTDLLAKKITNLRIFPDENGKLNLSLTDIGVSITMRWASQDPIRLMTGISL